SDPRGSDSQTAGRGRRPPLRAARRAEAVSKNPGQQCCTGVFLACHTCGLWLVACGLWLTAYRLKLASASASASASALHRRCQVRLDGGQHGLEALRIAGNDLALFQELVATGEVADQAARLLNEQATGGHVPFGQTEFPEGVIAAGGNVGQIQAGSATAADAGRLADQAAEHPQIVVQIVDLVLLEREAGTQQGAVQALAVAYPQALAVECCTPTAAGGEFFLAYRIENDRMLDATLDAAGDAHGKVRYAAQEVGGAIQRVDDPDDIRAFTLTGLEAGLFGVKAVIRVGLAQMIDDGLFCSPVDFADVVVRFLLVDGQDVQPLHGA